MINNNTQLNKKVSKNNSFQNLLKYKNVDVNYSNSNINIKLSKSIVDNNKTVQESLEFTEKEFWKKKEYIEEKQRRRAEAKFNLLKRFHYNLCSNRMIGQGYMMPVCSDCFDKGDKVPRLIDVKSGRGLYIKMNCLSPYCDDEDCVSNRKALNFLKLGGFAISQEESKSKKNTWRHVILGCDRINLKDFNKNFIIENAKNLRNFLKVWKKQNPSILNKGDFYLKGLGVMDLAYDSTDNSIFLHYHLIVRPYKGMLSSKQLIKLNKISKNHKLKVVFIKQKDKLKDFNCENMEEFSINDYNNYSKTKSEITLNKEFGNNTLNLVSYLSKRLSGLYGHEEFNSNFMLKDLFSEEEYFNIFKNTKRFYSFGWSGKYSKWIKNLEGKRIFIKGTGEKGRLEAIKKNEIKKMIEGGKLFTKYCLDSLSSKITNNCKPLFLNCCIKCGSTHWRLIGYDKFLENPPNTRVCLC